MSLSMRMFGIPGRYATGSECFTPSLTRHLSSFTGARTSWVNSCITCEGSTLTGTGEISTIRDRIAGTFEVGRVKDFQIQALDGVVDPHDRHVHGAALACAADVLLTFNVRDFPGGVHYDVMTPDEFLVLVDDAAPMVCDRPPLSRPPIGADVAARLISRSGYGPQGVLALPRACWLTCAQQLCLRDSERDTLNASAGRDQVKAANWPSELASKRLAATTARPRACRMRGHQRSCLPVMTTPARRTPSTCAHSGLPWPSPITRRCVGWSVR